MEDALRCTREGVVTGTPWYMSPEQAACDRQLDGRSDLFSVGVVLFEMLAGALPFPGRDHGEVIRRIRSEPAPDLADLRPDLPARLRAIVRKALHKEREGRYQSAAAFASELERVSTAYSPTLQSGAPDAGPSPGSPPVTVRGLDGAGQCGACGREILSRLGVGGRCRLCDEPLCNTCWQARGLTACTDHQEQDAADLPAPSQEEQPLENEVETLASEPGVSRRQARVREESFLRATRNALRRLQTVVDPVTGQEISVGDWQRAEERTDRRDVVRRILGPTGFSREGQTYPLGPTLKFHLRRRTLVPGGAAVTVMAQCLTRVEQICLRRSDARPIDQVELEDFLNGVARQAARERHWHLAIAGSPTGFAEEACEYVTAQGRQGFRSEMVSAVLYEHGRGEFSFDPTDEKLASYREAFVPEAPRRELAEAADYVRAHLQTSDSIALSQLCEASGLDRRAAMRVFGVLSAGGEFILDTISGVGVVLYRSRGARDR